MTVESEVMEKVVRLLSLTSAATAGLALSMKIDGDLTDKASSDLAKIFREIAEIYEFGLADKIASQFWTTAIVLEKPSTPE